MNDADLERFKYNLDNHQIDMLLLESIARKPINGIERLIVDEDMCEL